MNARLAFVWLSAIILLITALAGSALPLYLRGSNEPAGPHTRNWRTISYSLGNCLAAGVMLSAAYCHLLADSLEDLAFVGTFPMATFLAAVGYLITLVADQVIVAVTEAQQRAEEAQAMQSHAWPCPPGKPATALELSNGGALATGSRHLRQSEAGDDTAPLLQTRGPTTGGVDDGSKSGKLPSPLGLPVNGTGRYRHQDSFSRPLLDTACPSPSVGNSLGGGLTTDDSVDMRAGVAAPWASPRSNGGALLPRSQPAKVVETSDGGTAPEDAAEAGRVSNMDATELCDHAGHMDLLISGHHLRFGTALLLAAALCVHSVLEGMALGAQQDLRAMQDILVAIAAHKGLAAYALGASVVETGANLRRFWLVTGLFSMASPLAIFIGYFLSEVSHGLGGAALSALASGTFLYVAVMEVMPKELGRGNHAAPNAPQAPLWLRAAKLGALLLGFGAMSVLAIWA